MVTPTYNVFAKFFDHETCPFLNTDSLSFVSRDIVCRREEK